MCAVFLRPFRLVLLAITLLGTADLSAAPVFEYVGRLGLFDAAHTSPDGTRDDVLVTSSHTGYFGGVSAHHVGSIEPTPTGGESPNQTAWVVRPDLVTVRVGLYAGEFSTSSGAHASTVLALSASGISYGESTRYQDDAAWDRAFWRADRNGVTTQLRFVPGQVNSRGAIIGHTGGGPRSHTMAWLCDPAGIEHPIGQFPDAPFSTAADLSDSGRIVGWSGRMDGTAWVGAGAWLREPDGTYVKVGLNDAKFVEGAGGDTNGATLISESGYVAGFALGGPLPTGSRRSVPWVRDLNGVTRQVGIVGADTGGAHVYYLNEQGYALGHTDPLSSGVEYYWMASPAGETRRVGLFGPEYVRNSTRVVGLSDGGIAAGYAWRSSPPNPSGTYATDAFIAHKSGSSRVLAITDATHVRDDGAHVTVAEGISADGIVWGSSVRFLGAASPRGQTAWFYDSATRVMTLLEFSVRPADGYAFSRVHRVLRNGTVLGTYTRFVGNTDTGERAFAWIPGTGFVKIDVNMDVDVHAEGWRYFDSADHASSAGLVAGGGVFERSAISTGVYLVRRASH